MYNPITKVTRYLRREYPESSATTAIAASVGLGIGLALTLSSAGVPLIFLPLFPAGTGGIIRLIGLGIDDNERRGENKASLNGMALVGSPRDVDSLIMTQRLINSITKKMKHLPELPPRTAKRIARHIGDLQKKIARVRVYDSSGQPAPAGFSFTREMIDTSGRTVCQTLATISAPMSEKEARALLLPKVLATPGPLALPAPASTPFKTPDLTSEFGTLAQKVSQVEQRVGQLENPAPAQLDKPKLAKPV